MSDQWENLRAQYLAEPWGKLAQAAGFDPVNTESSARSAFHFCADRIDALEAALRDVAHNHCAATVARADALLTEGV
jgi:hypothetical protein